jgi:hypothetical protein
MGKQVVRRDESAPQNAVINYSEFAHLNKPPAEDIEFISDSPVTDDEVVTDIKELEEELRKKGASAWKETKMKFREVLIRP